MAPKSASQVASQIEGISLQEFVQQALLDICNGIIGAQSAAETPVKGRTHSAIINPIPLEPEAVNWADFEHQIEFDILVTGESKNVGNASAGLKMLGIGGDLNTERTVGSSIAHRLKFSVPVVLPGKRIADYKKKPKA